MIDDTFRIASERSIKAIGRQAAVVDVHVPANSLIARAPGPPPAGIARPVSGRFARVRAEVGETIRR